MKSLAIIGAGGHAKVVADTALHCGWEHLSFFDAQWPTQKQVGIWDVTGNMDSFLTKSMEFDGVIVAIGNNKIRLEKINLFLDKKIPIATLIHPRAVVSAYAIVEAGTVVFANAVLNPFSHVGLGAIINTSCVIEHDCHLGQGVHVSPGAHLAGGVTVGDLSWIGIGASVRQNITIGSNVMVGAGAAVVKDLPNQCTAIGVPAIIQNQKEPLC